MKTHKVNVEDGYVTYRTECSICLLGLKEGRVAYKSAAWSPSRGLQGDWSCWSWDKPTAIKRIRPRTLKRLGVKELPPWREVNDRMSW